MLDNKINKLKEYIAKQQEIIIAFSGGIDSTLLAYYGKEIVGEKCIALTVLSDFISQEEKDQAIDTAKELQFNHHIISANIFDHNSVIENNADRCYQCKKVIFQTIIDYGNKHNIHCIFEGSNADDRDDYRPGKKALLEKSIQSPLDFFNFTKDDIRTAAKNLNIKIWDKPSSPCLATRIPYDERITIEALHQIEEAEKILTSLGLSQVRVRVHGSIARIEILPNEMNKIFENNLNEKIYNEFKSIGFDYTTLDLRGYRTGSMNETLKDKTNG